jgi:hypothetical protein
VLLIGFCACGGSGGGSSTAPDAPGTVGGADARPGGGSSPDARAGGGGPDAPSGGGGADARPAADAPPFTGGMTWTDDGVPKVAIQQAIVTGRKMTDKQDFLEVVGADYDYTGISIAVSVQPPAVLGGSYTCAAQSIVVVFTYVGSSGSATVNSCSIDITAPGVPGVSHAVGTFSAELTVDGKSKTISDGRFDVAVTALP